MGPPTWKSPLWILRESCRVRPLAMTKENLGFNIADSSKAEQRTSTDHPEGYCWVWPHRAEPAALSGWVVVCLSGPGAFVVSTVETELWSAKSDIQLAVWAQPVHFKMNSIPRVCLIRIISSFKGINVRIVVLRQLQLMDTHSCSVNTQANNKNKTTTISIPHVGNYCKPVTGCHYPYILFAPGAFQIKSETGTITLHVLQRESQVSGHHGSQPTGPLTHPGARRWITLSFLDAALPYAEVSSS